MSIVELLNASHIVPWSIDINNRVNPRNGLCLNAIHDRAFDRGLITITPDYQVKVSSKVKTKSPNNALKTMLLNFEGAKIALPAKFVPAPVFLEYHNEKIFIE